VPSSHRTLRVLGAPKPVRVALAADGRPASVDGRAVETAREEWRVEEGWWTDRPVQRRYLELVLEGGRVEVVFEDRLRPGSWFRQRA
jgi:hypothetical protein